MASLTQCPDGHFYDPKIYASCPYCDNLSQKVNRNGSEGENYTMPLSGASAGMKRETGFETVSAGETATADSRGTVNPEEDSLTTIVRGDRKLVVGWLAAIEGPYRGRSFELHQGYSRVGRKTGEIRLENDSSISRDTHFKIVYDEEDNRFFAFGGESDNFVRVNGEKRYAGERAELKPYSEIAAGKSKFLFIPLCSEQFRWPQPEGTEA